MIKDSNQLTETDFHDLFSEYSHGKTDIYIAIFLQQMINGKYILDYNIMGNKVIAIHYVDNQERRCRYVNYG